MRDGSIVVPVDTSSLCEAAIREATELAQALQRRVCLLTVVDSVVAEGVAEFAAAEGISTEDAVESYLRRLAEPLSDHGIDVDYARMNGGWRAADGILDYVANHDVSMIVMSSHGRSGLSRLMLGSVAERVVRSAPCPVLIVPVRERHDG